MNLHPMIALLAAGAAGIAIAQAPAAPADASPPPANASRVAYVDEPVASTAGGASPHAAIANTIAQALNAEPSLKGSKLSVVAEENGVLLTGVTPTVVQMAKAVNIASQQAGAPVAHSISTEEVFIDVASMAQPPSSG